MNNQRDEFEMRTRGGDVRITRRVELNFWKTCLLNAAGLLIAGFTVEPNQLAFGDIWTFSLLVMTIWFLNWIIRPILVVFTLPFIIFTLGIGMMFINALIIYLAARILPFDGVVVANYWVALWAAFWVSVFSWGVAMSRSERIIRRVFKNVPDDEKKKNSDDDIIDV